MSATAQFKVETDEHVAWLTLNRPEKRNTMGTFFFKELSEHLDTFDRETAIRAVVIKAEGKSFTAGTDLTKQYWRSRGASTKLNNAANR